MKNNLILLILITVFISFGVQSKGDKESRNCNVFACLKKSKLRGKPQVFIKNESSESLVCFLRIDQRKKLFLLGPDSLSRKFTSKYESNYQYVSWNCDKTSSCPMWGKRFCK